MARVAVVTGGTRGIGAAIVAALAQAGYGVAATGVRTAVQAAAPRIYHWDVSDYDACQAGIAAIEADMGAVDILVNNAGITRDAQFAKMPADAWREVLATNVTGAFNMAKAVFASMAERRWGRIINIGSINGQAGQFGQVNYSASKSALHGFTKALAIEGARNGVTVNLIAPGYIETEMTGAIRPDILQALTARIPLGRLGRPEEIARAVLFLAHDDAGYITGSTISINGGQYMS